MTHDLTGTWTGEMSGTNSGGMTLELKQEGDRLYGQGRFCEPSVGAYEYAIQGVARGEGGEKGSDPLK